MIIDWSKPTGQLKVGGRSLEWGVFGPAPADCGRPVIVMLHEGLGCLALWRDFPEQLAQATGHPVFAYSRAGYGQSDADDLPRPLTYMTREAISVLPEILGAISAEGLILMGHSDGATIAAIYAGKVFDLRLRGLIAIAPHFFAEPMGLAEIADAKVMFETTDMKDRMAKYHRDPEATFRGWNDAWLDPGFEAWNVEDALDMLRVPTLAVQGADDQYGTLAQVRAIKERSPESVDLVVLDGCRHSPHVDRPESTLAVVTDFVTRLEASKTNEEFKTNEA